MKTFSTLLLIGALLVAPQVLSAQLLPEQRLQDFQNLAALYAKRYAPYDWKKQALGFDLLDLKPWLARIQVAKDDLEFFEIEAEYVAKLQDTHSSFSMTSSFRANLGITVDIYDGKVLIDGINRSLLPLATYPFQIGDELVSVDGVSVEDWIARISKWRQWGNPASTRRMAALQITFRSQPSFPRAAEIGTSAIVEIRRANGVLERYTIPWTKTGIPVTTVGPVPFPRAATEVETNATPENVFDELNDYRLPANDLVLESVPWATDNNGAPRKYVIGIASNRPVFVGGLPSNFVQRLGRAATDFHFSGTYVSNGLTIGYLRIPNFAPPGTALTELRNEIDFLQRNTDGLVVDVMRNPGGGCYMLDVAAALIPYPFYFFGEQIRVTQDRLNAMQNTLETLQLLRTAGLAEQRTVDMYQVYVDEMKAAFSANRGVTDPIAACAQSGQINPPPVMFDNAPGPVVYTKPIIVLIDEFSISAADIFPSMIQDNGRALLVGTRTSGGGGSVSNWPTGFYSESLSNNTNTLVVRKRPIVTTDYPTAPYVENIGARPDIPLNFMTRENLLNGGRTFVDQFTQIIVDQIRKTPGPVPFAVSNFGSVSLSTPGTSTDSTAGYVQIQADAGRTTASGLAIIGLRQRNVLVTEAGIPATPLIQSGRIYVEMSGSVNTGIAIANPNNQPAAVQFYFTGPQGNVGAGTTTIDANGQIAKFLDEVPFSGAKPLAGTFTFISSVPVAAVALRGLTNERGEFLITTLPVVDMAATASTEPLVLPHFADGGGWSTQVVLVNPSDSQLTGTVQFYDPAGNAAAVTIAGQTRSSFDYSIPPRTSQTLVTSGLAGSVQAGSVRVVPGGTISSPSGLVIFSSRQNSVTVTEAGVPAATSGSAFRLYAEVSGDFARGLSGSIQTGLAISNSSNAAAVVTLELKRLDGSSTGLSATIQVPANGQISKFIYQIPGLASPQLPFQGLLRISSSTPISVVGLRSHVNERREILITTTPPVNEGNAPTNTDLFFPHFADGGGYTTQFILFSGSSGQQTSGALRLVNQSGLPMNLTLH